MGERQAPWNKYEAAVLLQGFLNTKNGKMSRTDAIREVSELLREMALASGIDIDDTFRNINGISFQMHSMESAYYGRTSIKPATKLFCNVVAMSLEEFSQVLLEAYFRICGTEINKEMEEPTEMALSINALTKKLQETMSKVAPYGSYGVSAEELAAAVQEPVYKVLYLLDSCNWVAYNGKRYTLAKDVNIPQYSAPEKPVPSNDNPQMEELQRIMERVAGPKTRGVTTAYLAFALKCTETEVHELVSHADWIEKCGDLYQCNASKMRTKMPSKALSTPVPTRKEKGKNDPSVDRLRSIMLLFAPANSSGVTMEYLSFALGCPVARAFEFVSRVDWVEKIGDRYRLRGSQIDSSSSTDVKTVQQFGKERGPSFAVKKSVSAKKSVPDTQLQKADSVSMSRQFGEETLRTVSSEQNDSKKEFTDGCFPDYIRSPGDRELFEKYPVLFKRTFNAMRDATGPVPLSQIYNATSRISRIEAVEEILDGASWAQQKNTLYTFTSRDKDQQVESNNAKNTQEASIPEVQTGTIDFNEIGDLSFTKPVSYRYFDIYKDGFNSWKDLYADFLGCYYEDYPHLLYPGASFSAKENVRPDIADRAHKAMLLAPRDIPGSNLCVETNFDVSYIARRLKRLLDIGNLDYENLTITYTRRTVTQTVQGKKEETLPVLESPDERSQFTDWLQSIGTVAENVKSFVTAINLSEKYAKELKCTHTRFWGDDPTETKLAYNELLANDRFVILNQKKSNIFSRALRKYMEFQRERQQRQSMEQKKPVVSTPPLTVESAPKMLAVKSNETIHALLLEEYPNGFRLNSSLEMKKFKKKYESMYGVAPGMLDEQIERSICQCGIVHDNRLYCPEKMLDEDTKEKLERYIKESFNNGKKCLFFEALFHVFSGEFLNHYIYDADMLKAYLQSFYHGQYFFFSNYFSVDPNATSDPTEEIVSCVIEYGKPIVYEELYRLLPHIPEDKIRLTLNTTKEFISNGRKQYFHIRVFRISDDELNDIADIIHFLLQRNKYISGNELVEAIRAKLPYVMEANLEISDIGIRNALALLLGNKFSFKGNIISALGVEIEMKDVFSEFSKNTPSFTIDELSKLASDLNSAIYFDYVYKNAVRISLDNFVRKDLVSFDIQRIDQILDSFCSGKYISIQGITNFVAFPDCGYPWNSFLLESYVAGHSKRYCLLHNTFGTKSVSGAIVKRSSGINSLDLLVTLVVADSSCLLKKDQALEYLYDHGYLGQRRYSTIEKVLIDAQTIRNKRGK